MLITQLLTTNQIIMQMTATDKIGALRELASLISLQVGMDSDTLVQQLIDRETLRTTGYGKGVAMPRTCHGKADAVALGICKPINWESVDKHPVHLIFMFISQPKKINDHIELVSEVAKILSNDIRRAEILEAKTPEQIIQVFKQAEKH